MAVSEEQVIRGVGHSVKRFEDARFIRGKGNYFDDITLPGMLHLEFLRSPFAHARITSIDTLARRGGRGRRRRRHGRAARAAQPRLDADALRRHPGGARHRQGALPGPGGRGGDRRVGLHRQGRARADRRRLRAAAGDHEPAAGARGRRGGDPRREGRPDRQPHLRLGGRRQGGDRQGLRRGGQGRRARHVLPALPSGAARVLRLRRRRQPGDGQGDHLHDVAGPARRTARSSRSSRACPSRRSGSSRPTWAAASATRCRSTPATSSRRRPRS